MPGNATHLAIADKIYKFLGESVIKDMPLFFCGNVAPDAIHAKPNYTREDKRHTHLTKDMPTDAFHNPDKLRLFHERVNEFIDSFYVAADMQSDLYLGYVTHLLSDELFNITKRTPFNRLIFTDGIDQSEKDLFEKILEDVDAGDMLILSQYPYTQNVAEVLDAVWDYEIKGYVGKDEVNNSKRYVINKFLNGASAQIDLKYYSYAEAVEFVDYAVEDCLKRLSGESDIIPILRGITVK